MCARISRRGAPRASRVGDPCVDDARDVVVGLPPIDLSGLVEVHDVADLGLERLPGCLDRPAELDPESKRAASPNRTPYQASPMPLQLQEDSAVAFEDRATPAHQLPRWAGENAAVRDAL